MYKIFSWLLIAIFPVALFAQHPLHQEKSYAIYGPSSWADSLIQTMTVDEKIGQLFMVAAYSNKDQKHTEEILSLIRDYHLGGLCMFQGTPAEHVRLVNLFQDSSKVPLLISMDAEWGPAMRLDSVMSWPRQMMLGAIENDSLIYDMGRAVAKQLKRLGVTVNLAPVVDINNNPLNPVIHTRSFGEDMVEVAEKGLAYTRGMQDEQLLAVAKHFPGHGDTQTDSHYDLPLIPFTKKRLDSLELYPFRRLIRKGVGGVMAAHLSVPSLDSTVNVPSSLSPAIIDYLLQVQMNFRGLIFSDALNMKGVAKYFGPGEAALKALMAGNDIILYPEDVPTAAGKIKQALADSIITESVIDFHVAKILKAKNWLGLDTFSKVETEGLLEELNAPAFINLKQQIVEAAITLVRNDSDFVPQRKLLHQRIAVVSMGAEQGNSFQEMISRYAPVSLFSIKATAKKAAYDELLGSLQEFDRVIVGLHNVSRYNVRTFGITTDAINFVHALNQRQNMLLVDFGTPYSLSRFREVHNLMLAYEDDSLIESVAAQMIFGGLPVKGRLPVRIDTTFALHSGIQQSEVLRLAYTLPEGAGIASSKLKGIDSIAQYAIKEGATPGCQILVAKSGKVIYHKSFGYHTYENEFPVKNTDIYDLASITKVAATTLAIMNLHEIRALRPADQLEKFLPDLRGNPKGNLTIKEILTHQAGLEAWIPFYKYTLTAGGICDSNYCYEPNDFTLQVARNLYIYRDYGAKMWEQIYNSPLGSRGDYVYSDIGFFFMKRIVDSLTGSSFRGYLEDNFYERLGMGQTGFNPSVWYPMERIVPTENDNYFRKELIHGFVHDPAAAMLGGVAGHAGLFSNANDLAILMQMLLNKGTYGGEQFFEPNTIELYTRKQYKNNRKGLGFDKPEMDHRKTGPTSSLASPGNFGHTGFTGTSMWADPENDMIYIFLSNRVYPTAANRKLISMNIRTEIEKVIYQSFLDQNKAGSN
ncbi:MAG: glycoside hydrolase family 3 N-terminal domain-containing protein [Bacteroidia bacterium]